MTPNLSKIKRYLENKNICLLGNAESILKHTKNIDNYDVICRINKGIPINKEKWIGSRTDILFLATYVASKIIINQFKPKFNIWLTPWLDKASNITKERAIQIPQYIWHELFELLNKQKPSSGLMSLYFLIKYINFKKLTIYGFDFFETHTWYFKGAQRWHNGEKEEKLIKTLIAPLKNVEIIYE